MNFSKVKSGFMNYYGFVALSNKVSRPTIKTPMPNNKSANPIIPNFSFMILIYGRGF